MKVNIKRLLPLLLVAGLLCGIVAPVSASLNELTYTASRDMTTVSDGTIRILTIGNSYGVDGYQYLSRIGAAAGVDMVTGVAYIGGCTFKQHLSNYQNGTASYTYYENGSSKLTKTDLATILSQHEWDYITFQLGTGSGVVGEPIPNTPYLNKLIGIITELHPQAELVYHLSWVDGKNSTRANFFNLFEGSRDVQWEYLVNWTKEAYNDLGIRFITPGGVAYYDAYEYFGDSLHRNGYHMSVKGRYLQACVWFEFFTGLSAPADYLPTTSNPDKYGEAPTAEECAILRECAHRAIEKLLADGGTTPAVEAGMPGWSVEGLQFVGTVKTSYKVGEVFDYSTFEVQSTTGGTVKTVTDFTLSNTAPLTKEDTAITLSYDGLSIEIPLQVK